MRRTWSAIAPQTEFVAIAGNHLTMLQAPFVESLSQDIGRRIASAFRPREAAPDNPRGAASIEHPS
jgi:thioesterase domain-containing protein